jgi:Uma2 family endonuclease
MQPSQTKLWSVEEYHRMMASGILHDSDRVELVRGQILTMSPQHPPHSATTHRASRVLSEQLAGRAEVRSQLPITLPPDSEPEPDIAVVRIDPREYADRHPGPADILLVIEVSDSTLRRDRNLKAPAYADAGIGECWILDVNTRRLFVLREPHDGGYRSETILGPADQLSPLAFPDVLLTVGDLFPAPLP